MRFVSSLRTEGERISFYLYECVRRGRIVTIRKHHLKHQPECRLEAGLVLNEFLESVIMGLIAFAR